MGKVDSHLHLTALATDQCAGIKAICDAHIAAAFVSVAYDRALIEGTLRALEESRELISRINCQFTSRTFVL